MIRKFQITCLMVFSVMVILFGGYNCAYQTTLPNSEGDISIDRSNGGQETNVPGVVDNLPSTGDGFNLPDKPLDNYCNRGQYGDLEDTYGASAFVRLNKGNFEDYRLGRTLNFDVNCPRVYVDMYKSGSKFKGTVSITYEDGNNIKFQSYKTGSRKEEIKNNDWESSDFTPSSTGKISNNNFHAILEDSKTAAIIFTIEDLREKNLQDGETKLIGGGSIWFKMFRTFIGDKSDTCYKNGTYLSDARVAPSRPSAKCWLLNGGPYSCRPRGLGTNVRLKDRSYTCYDKLGTFGNLNVREAFNVRSTEDPDE